MNDLSQYISPELRAVIASGNFHKLAARMYGLTPAADGLIDEASVLKYMGTKLASRRAEYKQITAGINALNAFSSR